ncbi:hypothetical protein [Nostoc sp.]
MDLAAPLQLKITGDGAIGTVYLGMGQISLPIYNSYQVLSLTPVMAFAIA